MLKSVADVLGLLGLAALSIPAWYANRYGHLVAQMDLKHLNLAEPEFKAQYEELMAELRDARDGWKPWKGWLFWIGTLMGIVAAVLVVYAGVTEPTPPATH